MESEGRTINAWTCSAPNEKLEKQTITLPPLQSDEVEIKVLYCGICHSDLHILDGHWQTIFPCVVGHEIVGKVTTLGSQVTHLEVGQIVGVGWQKSCCQNCQYCRQGMEQYCEEGEATCMGNYGGFAEYHQTKAIFAIPIPKGLSFPHVSCLMCGGATTFTSLKDYDVKPYHKIAVIGIGGLGHLAIKWGVKWGCEVTAFSTSSNKEEQAKSFGAHNFVVYSSETQKLSPEAKKKYSLYFDFILVTIPYKISSRLLLSCLKKTGKMCYVSEGGLEFDANPSDLFFGCGKSIGGCSTSSIGSLHTMIDFANRHQVLPQIEIFPVDKINEAIEKVKKNQIQYKNFYVLISKSIAINTPNCCYFGN